MKMTRWLVCPCGVFVLFQTAQAATISWAAASDGNFGDPLKWTGGNVPGLLDVATFDKVGTYTVTFTADAMTTNFNVSKGSVTWNLGGFTYTVTNTTANAFTTIGSGVGDLATLTISNGTVIVTNVPGGSGYFRVGSGSGTGTVNVAAGGILNIKDMTQACQIYENGQLRVSDGGMLIYRIMTLAGTVTVANAGMITNGVIPATNVGGITIGSTTAGLRKGELWVTNGGVVYAGGVLVGYQGNDGSKLVVSDPGSIFDSAVQGFSSSTMYLAAATTNASIVVTNGGYFRFREGGSFKLANSDYSTGTVTIAGNGAKMVLEGTATTVGNVAFTTGSRITIGNGGSLIVSNANILLNTNIYGLVVEQGGTVCFSNMAVANPLKGLQMKTNSALSGAGLIYATVGSTCAVFNSGGTIMPGSPGGTLTISNMQVRLGYNSDTSRLLIGLGGTSEGEYGRLSTVKGDYVASSNFLGGVCEVVLTNGFVPQRNDTFNILDWDNLVTNRFSSVIMPSLAFPKEMITNNLYVNGEIFVGGPVSIGTVISIK